MAIGNKASNSVTPDNFKKLHLKFKKNEKKAPLLSILPLYTDDFKSH